MVDLTLLDQSVAKLVDAAADLPVEDLVALLGAEEIGKTRSSAIASLKELIAMRTVLDEAEEPIEEPEGGVILVDAEPLNPTISWDNPNVVTNCVEGTVLHLGDGRRLAYGESEQVSAEIAALLRANGQAQ